MNVLEYWREATALIGIVIAYFGGKRSKKIKEDTEAASAIEVLQKVYDKYMEHDKERTDRMIARIDNLEKVNDKLQVQFNNLNLNYLLVSEYSKKWEKKYNALEVEYTILKTDHDTLKKEFEEYKTSNK